MGMPSMSTAKLAPAALGHFVEKVWLGWIEARGHQAVEVVQLCFWDHEEMIADNARPAEIVDRGCGHFIRLEKGNEPLVVHVKSTGIARPDSLLFLVLSSY